MLRRILARRGKSARRCAVAAVSLWLLTELMASPCSAIVAPHLRALSKDARLIVTGDVVGVTSYDQGRVAVATVNVERVLKGKLAGDSAQVDVVERRDLPTPPLFRDGELVLAFLRAAPRSSSLNAILPKGLYYSTTALDSSCLIAESPDDLAELTRIVELVVAESRNPRTDPGQRALMEREIAFELLAARHPVLVGDGAASLTSVPLLSGTLSGSELNTLNKVLRREDLPVRIRVALVRAVGAAGIREAVPVLQTLTSPPEVMAAAWQALDELHAPPSTKTLEERLASDNPQIRAAAVRELLRREGTDAVSKAAPVALQDPDPAVRTAAIEALGALGKPEALPPLERVFSEETGELQQASARAIIAVGGRPAIEAFGRLAFTAPPAGQRYAFVLLMALGVNRDDPVVRHIAETHPDESIRRLATHGIDIHKH